MPYQVNENAKTLQNKEKTRKTLISFQFLQVRFSFHSEVDDIGASGDWVFDWVSFCDEGEHPSIIKS